MRNKLKSKRFKDQPAQAVTDWLSLLLQDDQTENCICDSNNMHTNHQSVFSSH